MFSNMQIYLRAISTLDVLLFLCVLIGSWSTEKYVCEMQPFEIPLLDAAIHSAHNDTETQETIWGMRQSILQKASQYGPEAYHIVFISMWTILISYFVIEIWLYCVIEKAITQKRLQFCKKWLIWRLLLLIPTIGLILNDFSKHILTCTDAFMFPLSLLRIFLFFHICYFTIQLKSKASYSSDTIVMVGSEKL